MRIAEIFNKLSPTEHRPEPACTYRIFQMQQTHKYDHFFDSTNCVDTSETSTVAKLRDLQVVKAGGNSTKKTNAKAWGRKKCVSLGFDFTNGTRFL